MPALPAHHARLQSRGGSRGRCRARGGSGACAAGRARRKRPGADHARAGAPGCGPRPDRGAAARSRAAREFEQAVEREARAAAETDDSGDGRQARSDAACRRSRSTPRARATSTTRSPPNAWVTIPPTACACGCTSPTSRAYVPEGSLVDLEARRRGTSVYVPGAVEPMLPEALSNDACSLVPGVERAAVTVELELHGAEVVKAAFYRSLIRSDERLSYERSIEIFAGRERASEPWARAAEGRARGGGRARGRPARGTQRRADARLRPSPSSSSTRTGTSSEVRVRVQTESHRLIEHLMIAANEAVARLLSERGTPCLYRVHERPEPERVQAPRRPARLAGGADAAGAEEHVALAGGRADGGDLPARRARTCSRAQRTDGLGARR